MITAVVNEQIIRVADESADTVAVVIEPRTVAVEVGIAGPQGPQGETGPAGPAGQATVDSGPVAERPVSGDAEGQLYAATDEDQLYIWFD